MELKDIVKAQEHLREAWAQIQYIDQSLLKNIDGSYEPVRDSSRALGTALDIVEKYKHAQEVREQESSK